MNRIQRVFNFYRDGFASMTIGRTLWAIILIKLAIIFLVLKLLFFPDFLSRRSQDEGSTPAELVKQELLDRSTSR